MSQSLGQTGFGDPAQVRQAREESPRGMQAELH